MLVLTSDALRSLVMGMVLAFASMAWARWNLSFRVVVVVRVLVVMCVPRYLHDVSVVMALSKRGNVAVVSQFLAGLVEAKLKLLSVDIFAPIPT